MNQRKKEAQKVKENGQRLNSVFNTVLMISTWSIKEAGRLHLGHVVTELPPRTSHKHGRTTWLPVYSALQQGRDRVADIINVFQY